METNAAMGATMASAPRTIRTKSHYATGADLFERIRGERFMAGRPALVTSGQGELIVFPPLDRQNQVSVKMLGSDRVEVRRSELDGARPEFDQPASANARLVERLIEVTAAELANLGL